MSLSAAEIRTEVRALLNETTAAFWSDTEIDNWVSQAAIQISSVGAVESTATVTLVASTIEYAIPTTFANPTVTGGVETKIAAALYANTGLVRIHPRAIGHITTDLTDDTPRYWAQFGTRFFTFPVGSGASGTIQLLCHVKTDDIADIPDVFQPLAILYAAGKGKEKDNKFADARFLLSEYYNGLGFLRNDILERGLDAKQMLTIPNEIIVQ